MSAVMPEQNEQIQVFDLEEFEIACEIFGVAPEWAVCDGSAPARWIARRGRLCACGIVLRLVCDGCKVKLGGPTRCLFCKTAMGSYSFEPLGSP